MEKGESKKTKRNKESDSKEKPTAAKKKRNK